MTKTYLNVADDFSGGLINLAGHPVSYGAGDVIVIDQDSLEDRAIRDLGMGAHSNNAKRTSALAALIEGGDITHAGDLSDAASGTHVWSLPVSLDEVANNDTFRIKPGFAGRVIGISAVSTEDATTTSKSGSFGIAIDPADGDDADLSDEKVTVQINASGGSMALDYASSGSPQTINANATESAFQTAVNALLTAAGVEATATVVRSGSANNYIYTITAPDVNLAAFSKNDASLTGGTQTTTITVVEQGGGNRLVGTSGNPATLDLTSSNVGDGGVIAGETIATGSNPKNGNFTEDDTLVLTYTTSAAFAEGAVLVQVVLLAT